MSTILKRIAASLPDWIQHELKRYYFYRQIRKKTFVTDEVEYELLDTIVKDGDWVLDIGANVGHYSCKLSSLVGPEGRVIAFEPVPRTFEILSANAQHFKNKNITLLNLAASDRCVRVGFQIPKWDVGLSNYYRASISDEKADVEALTFPVDSLDLPSRVSLVKIDVEGHELSVLRGMTQLIQRDRPVLIVEASSEGIVGYLSELGYESTNLPGSSNFLLRPRD